MPPLRPHPLPEPLPGVADAVDAGEQLGHQRLLDGAMAEVGVDGLRDGRRVVDQDPLERAQVLDALLVGRVGLGEIRPALEGEDALGLVLGRVDASELSRLGHRGTPFEWIRRNTRAARGAEASPIV